MFRELILTAVVIMCATVLCLAADSDVKVQSGLQTEETIGSFVVDDVTGPASGKSICYACRYGSRPVVCVFTREITEDVATLIRQLDKQVEKYSQRQLKAFVVHLSEDPEPDREELSKLRDRLELKNVPLTLFDGITGPRNCRISQRAALTVVLWSGQKVKANHAFKTSQPGDDTISAVISDVARMVE